MWVYVGAAGLAWGGVWQLAGEQEKACRMPGRSHATHAWRGAMSGHTGEGQGQPIGLAWVLGPCMLLGQGCKPAREAC